MTLKIGTILIAKEDAFMDTKEKCLTKGKEYIIKSLKGNAIVFESDFDENHEWLISEIDTDFTIKRYTLTDLKEKKIAVKLRNYEEYKRLCEAVGDDRIYEFYFIGDETYYGVIKPGCFIQLNEYELKGRTLVPSIDLIDLEEKEEVVNECEISPLYVDKLESEIARLKGENELQLTQINQLKEYNEKLLSENSLFNDELLKVTHEKDSFIEKSTSMIESMKNASHYLTSELIKENQKLKSPDLEKRERMAWELMLRSVQVENSKHYSLSAEYCLNEVDTFLAKSKEVGK